MGGTALWQWDATDLASAIRERRVSAREATAACLDRIATVNPAVNALTEINRDPALAAAAEADARMAAGAPLPPLHGVPVTTKINVDQAGSATTNGVAAFTSLVAAEDSPPVANWRKAGAILLGRSNAPAFSCRWFTDNAPHGLTLNPWNTALNVGGSSGGAAAAVATGMVPLAHGNDLAGSARLPASACGVYGLRPTTGRVPAYNPTGKAERSLCLQLGSTQGVLARSVRDIRLGLETMARRDPRDPAWVPVPLDFPDDAWRQRVALFTGTADHAADAPVLAALRRAADALASAGYEVVETAPPRFEEAAALWMTLLSNDCRSPGARAAFALGDETFLRSLDLTAACVPALSAEEMLASLASRTTFQRAWQMFFEDLPLLLMPTAWSVPFPVGYDVRGVEEARRLLTAHSPCTATAFLGVPALSVPVHRGTDGPLGVQLVAGRFRDGLVLAAATALEERLGPIIPIDPQPSSAAAVDPR
ncbi:MULTISPECIES: amidase [Nitrospirillum]|uniref:Amidase n=1 Tax=Nitrospirillum amazonense TaxID=28077 RepID=A0A560FVD9_9PROT|nr:amidase [Nitrospirillum amazonense]MEC4594926.1 amidase [Nitrospirillum amazonense]TWB25608.1 amidase [Nitrospirillum amazonense]